MNIAGKLYERMQQSDDFVGQHFVCCEGCDTTFESMGEFLITLNAMQSMNAS